MTLTHFWNELQRHQLPLLFGVVLLTGTLALSLLHSAPHRRTVVRQLLTALLGVILVGLSGPGVPPSPSDLHSVAGHLNFLVYVSGHLLLTLAFFSIVRLLSVALFSTVEK